MDGSDTRAWPCIVAAGRSCYPTQASRSTKSQLLVRKIAEECVVEIKQSPIVELTSGRQMGYRRKEGTVFFTGFVKNNNGGISLSVSFWVSVLCMLLLSGMA